MNERNEKKLAYEKPELSPLDGKLVKGEPEGVCAADGPTPPASVCTTGSSPKPGVCASNGTSPA